MKKWLILGILLWALTVPVGATSVVAPEIPDEAKDVFPAQTEDFSAGSWHILKQAFSKSRTAFGKAAALCLSVIGTAVILSFLRGFEGKANALAELAGVLSVTTMLLGSAHSIIELGTETVQQISDYGKLLLPVMTAALTAQGGTATAVSVYGATALFDALLCAVMSALLLPAVYIYLVLAIMDALTRDNVLKKMKELVKWATSWFFKLLISVFTGYITISGAISGTVDQAAVKATKLTISGMIPVIGSVLSDASETVLVSAGLVKNAAGIYGMLAVLALTATPFFTIGAYYLLLKLTAAVSGIFAPKTVSALLEDFTGAMGMILGMVGSACLIQLVSVVCFLKGMT